MILITGATGHFGKGTIDSLLEKGIPANTISALARNPEKAEALKATGVNVIAGDYNDEASLKKAFAGVDKLLFVSGSDLQNRVQQHHNVIKAAKEAGVKHIIYTSYARKNETETSPIAIIGQQHLETEKAIRESGIPYTFLLNTLYADMVPMYVGEKVFETGIYLPAGNGKTSFTTRRDMAEAAAVVLTTAGHDNKAYVIAGNDNHTMHEVAALLTELTGKPVAYNSPSKEVYVDTITKAGMPLEYASLFAGFMEAIEQGEFETADPDLEKLLGRKPTSLRDYLGSVYAN